MRKPSCVVGMVLLLAAGLCAAAPAQELLVNGDFSAGTEGWTPVGTAPPCARREWDPGGFLRVETDCAQGSSDLGWVQTVPVAGGSHLLLSFKAMSRDLDGKGDVILTFQDPSGQVVWKTGVHRFTATTGWRTFHWALKVPDDAVSLELFAGAELIVGGSLALDDLSLQLATHGGCRTVTVDCMAPTGTIRDLRQTVRSPFADGHDFLEQFRATGIHTIRLHDEAAFLDMRDLFPDPDADPDDPASYDFDRADDRVQDIVDAGIHMVFRLGESWSGLATARMSAAKWAEVVTHIVRHYNEGWADGFRFGIRWWEIWNEPNGGHFWDGTDEEFYELYSRAATAIKTLDPSLRVGGPALAGFESLNWMRGFLDYIAAHGAPLDFFSWHTYHMGNPIHLADAQRTVRSILDSEGFTSTLVFPDEWNLSLGVECEERNCTPFILSAYATAHTASALIYLQDTDAPFCFRYRTDGYMLFGLFGDGVEDPPYSPSGLAYLLLAPFDATPVRLAATGSDDAGYAVLAGRAEPGRGDITILVADPGSDATCLDVKLVHPPAHFAWTAYQVADPIDCTPGTCEPPLVASGDESSFSGGALSLPMTSPAVTEIRITTETDRLARHPAGRDRPAGR